MIGCSCMTAEARLLPPGMHEVLYMMHKSRTVDKRIDRFLTIPASILMGQLSYFSYYVRTGYRKQDRI